ncbi:MAG: type 1 glutamine amidotransferase [Rhizobiaceae bacterium]
MARKRVLVVQNYDNTGLGQVERALVEAGHAIDFVRAQKGEALPADASGHDGAVVLGGGQHALDDAGSPWIPALLDLMRDIERRDRALLGICLGSQLMARAFGGSNQIGGASEFGWQEVGLDDTATDDPVLGALPRTFRTFQWHDDTFTLPPGATRLATGTVVANQAYRIGRAAYGMQFHFEADRTLVDEWSRAFPEWLAERQPGWNERRAVEAERWGAEADASGLAIARAWVAVV